MQMLYHSDNFVVVVFERPGTEAAPEPRLGGFEIVDKFARKEIFIEGALAERFQQGVRELVEQGPDAEAIDAFIGGFTAMAQQPLAIH